MQFGPPKTLACPFCETPVRMLVPISWNTFGAVLWSDTKLDGPFLPHLPFITRCSRCAAFFWLTHAPEFTGHIPRWAFWKRPRWARSLKLDETLDAIESGIASNTEDEITLRIRAWIQWNDRHRDAKVSYEPPSPRMTTNLEALSALLDAETPNACLMKAEVARERGNMEEARKMLGTEFPENLADKVTQMREWIAAGNARVCRFRDDTPSEEEREAKRRQAEVAGKARKKALIEAAHVVRARALKRGIATRENVDNVIRNLDIAAFRELAHDYPNLSRIHFKPIMPTRQSRRRVTVLKDPNVSPVNLIVLVALAAAVVMFAFNKCKTSHTHDERLPHPSLPSSKPVVQLERGEFR